MNQRWRDRIHTFRSPNEIINTSEFDVAEIAADSEPKAFIQQHHYSGTYPAARIRYGLYRRGELAGVAVFSHPCNDKVLTSVFPGAATDSVELGRFVLLDTVAGNGETWFLARCFERLRGKLAGVVSFSDPLPRVDGAGNTVFVGHVGTIYQAHNARYLGRGTARRLRLLPDGQVLSDRALQKIRAGERGWQSAAAVLEHHGATPCPPDNRSVWLQTWLPLMTRVVKHPGNHKYAWSFVKRKPITLPSMPYPKQLTCNKNSCNLNAQRAAA
jgi:hypothetical protein